MELEDMKQIWAEYDRKLDASMTLSRFVFRSSQLGKAETALQRLRRWLLAELLLTTVVALWLGSFLSKHAAEPRFLVPALALQVGVVALIIACIRQIVAISRIDYGAPVVTIQKQLEALRIERIRVTKWALILAPLAWTPLFLVFMTAVSDVNVYETFSTAWLVANVMLGLLVIAVALWASRRFAGRFEGSPLLARLMRDIAGHNLNAASEFLRSLAEFEGVERDAAPQQDVA